MLSIHNCRVSRLLIRWVLHNLWKWVGSKGFFLLLSRKRISTCKWVYNARNVSTSFVIINFQKLITSSISRLQVLCGRFCSCNVLLLPLLSVGLKDRIKGPRLFFFITSVWSACSLFPCFIIYFFKSRDGGEGESLSLWLCETLMGSSFVSLI